MKQARSIIWGIAIIALGVIFGGNALGLFDINIFFKGWWALFIIIPAFISLLTDSGKLGSFVFMSAGIILLLAAQEVFSYDVAWKVILALILIAIGLSIVFKNFFHSKDNEEIKKKAEDLKNDKMDSLSAAFSGNERIYKKEVFSGSNLSAAFGGVELDLRDAIFEKTPLSRPPVPSAASKSESRAILKSKSALASSLAVFQITGKRPPSKVHF